MAKLRKASQLMKITFSEWSSDKTSEMAAALAYYGVFALAPLIIIAVAVAGLIFGKDAAQGEVKHRLQNATGPTVAQALEDMLQYSQNTHSSIVATVIGVVILLVAVLSLFGQLQDSLNTIWGVQARSGRGWWHMIRDRLLSFATMLGVAVLLLASLLATSVLHVFDHVLHLSDLGLGGIGLWRAINWIVTFILVTLLFALIYKVLPDVRISWKDVWVGAAMTAMLFTIGNILIGYYLGLTGTASTYGAAGSIVVLMLWVYYSAQVLLFGAEFTQVYANSYGEPMVADDKADLVDRHTRRPKKLAERCGPRSPAMQGTAA
jgi:membrane protein